MSKPIEPADDFTELVDEANADRNGVLDNLIGLMRVKAYDAIRAMLLDKSFTRFLLNDELDYLRKFAAKGKSKDSRIN